MIRPTSRLPAAFGLFILLIILSANSHATDEFHAFITPETSYVELNDLVDVHFDVDSTARRFNGFEVTVQYDPSVVSFNSVVPGSLLTAACTDRFTHLDTTDSTLTYVLVLLCDQTDVYGPGRLCSMRFSADSHGFSPVAIVSDPDRTFFDAGLYVYPGHPTYPRQVVLRDGVIIVLDPNADCEESIADPGVHLMSIRPNPAEVLAQIAFELPEPLKVELTIHDAVGRVVRILIDDRRERTGLSGMGPMMVVDRSAAAFTSAK